MRTRVPALLLSSILLLPVPIQARPMPQPRGEIVIYRDRNFDGPAVSIQQEERNLRLVWTVNSARVHGGTWQLCERPNFAGSCMTLTSDTRNLGHRRVQSVRMTGWHGGWQSLGRTDINRVGWVHRHIDVEGQPFMREVRLCAERAQLRLHYARARFANGLVQQLHVPSQLADGSCTHSFLLTGGRRGLTAIDVTAATVGVSVRQGRLRIEGR
jgi:hypothetical protein